MALMSISWQGETPEVMKKRLLSAAAVGKSQSDSVAILHAGAKIVQAAAKHNIATKLDEGARTGKWPVTGTLGRSVQIRHMVRKRRVEIGPERVRYAKIHEYGGLITVKHAEFLVFYVRINGRKVKIKRKAVRIPARPYLRPALFDNEPKILQAMADTAMQRIKMAINKSV